ncbi:MAG: hypothetical protein ACLT2T_17590 [Bilophila wadsworthia]
MLHQGLSHAEAERLSGCELSVSLKPNDPRRYPHQLFGDCASAS